MMPSKLPAQPEFHEGKSVDLQLEVFINGAPRHLIASLRRTATGQFLISPDQLHNIGLLPVIEAISTDGLVVIDRLPGVTHRYDQQLQAIFFEAADQARVRQTVDAGIIGKPELRPTSDTGALVNYTVYGNWQGYQTFGWPAYQGVSGFFDTRAFSQNGVISHSFIARMKSSDASPEYVRLRTYWSYSNPDNMMTYTAGDLISRGPVWSRPIRLAGFQVRRNFSLRPDLITMPIPGLSGSAAVPSTVDVLVNNSKVYQGKIDGGPFQVTNLPIVSGPGTARLIIRDALGRETFQDVPFYASPSLLAPGLTDYSAEAGYARRNYGLESDNYDRSPSFSGSGRVGLTNTFTLESHAEIGRKLLNGGVGGIFSLGAVGVGSLAAAASQYGDETGYLAAASIEMRLQDWSIFARSQRTFGNYLDLAATSILDAPNDGAFWYQAQPPKAVDQVSLSIPIPSFRSSVNVSYTRLETEQRATSNIAGLSYTSQIFRSANLFLTGYRDFTGRSYGLFGGVTVPFGARVTVSSGVQSSNSGTVYSADAVRPLSGVTDYGWRVRLAEGSEARNAAALSYRLPSAQIDASVQQRRGNVQTTAQIDGAVVLMDSDVFFANRVEDAFAVVDTGRPGVEVSHQNRTIGRTNSRGKILLPHLQPWERNEISINPVDLPINADIDGVRKKVVPAAQSGVQVKFATQTSKSTALITLLDERGRYIDVGSIVRRTGSALTSIVGYDGQALVDGLDNTNEITVETANGRTCRAAFTYNEQPDNLVRIDNVVCR